MYKNANANLCWHTRYDTEAEDLRTAATLAWTPNRARWWMSVFFIGSSELCWLQWTPRTIQAVNSSRLCFTPWFHTKQRSECLIFYFKKFLRAYGRMLGKKKSLWEGICINKYFLHQKSPKNHKICRSFVNQILQYWFNQYKIERALDL